MPAFEPGLIERLKLGNPGMEHVIDAIARSIGPGARNPSGLLVWKVRNARAERADLAAGVSPEEAALIRDRDIFEARWPNASRYYTPRECAAYQKLYPGWTPECDLTGIIAKANAKAMEEPTNLDAKMVRQYIRDQVKRIAGERAAKQKHGQQCSCEECMVPHLEFYARIPVNDDGMR